MPMPMPCFTLFFYYFLFSISIGSIQCILFHFTTCSIFFFFLCACVLTSAARVRLRIERRGVQVQLKLLAIPYENAMGSNDFHGETLTYLPPDHSLYRIYKYLYSFIGGFGYCPGMARCGVCNCNCKTGARAGLISKMLSFK